MIDKQDEILAALLRIEKLLERKPVIVNNTFAGNPFSTKAAQNIAADALRAVNGR